jgi:hypothetical protein
VRHRDTGPLGHHRQQRLMLDGLEKRRRGPGVADAAQPDAAVGPVQQVGVPLVRAENLHEQGLPVAGHRLERPRSLRGGERPAHLADRHATRAKGRCHPGRAHPPVRHPERHQQAPSHRDPGGQRQHQLHGQQPAGDQPGRADQQQRGPGRPAPGPAQPRRRGHRDRGQSRQDGRIGEAGAGQPGTLAQPCGQPSSAARPGQVADSGHQRRRRHEPARYSGQHPEPAVAQRGGQQHQRRRSDHHLDQAGQHPPSRGHGPNRGDRGRSRPEQGGQQCSDHDSDGQYRGCGDQADHIARMPVPRRRQDQAPRRRLRLGGGEPHPGRNRHGQ